MTEPETLYHMMAETCKMVLSNLPMMAMSGKIDPMIAVILVPFLTTFIKWLIAWWSRVPTPVDNRVSVEILPYETYGYNIVYTKLSWYIENRVSSKLLVQPKYSQNRSIYIYSSDNTVKSSVPVFQPSQCKPFSLPFTNLEGKSSVIEISIKDRPISKSEEKDPGKKPLGDPIIVLKHDTFAGIKDFTTMVEEGYSSYKRKESYDPMSFSWSVKLDRWVGKKIYTKKTENNLFLKKEISTEIFGNLEKWINDPETYENLGLPYKIGYLFFGKPGCGKTSASYVIAKHMESHIYKVSLKAFIKEEDFFNVMSKIPENSVVIFEDIDCESIVLVREDVESNTVPAADISHTKKEDPPAISISGGLTLGSLLDVLDGNEYLHKCVVIMTTNRPAKLDPALIRSGRIEHQVCFDTVDFTVIPEIFETVYRNTNKKEIGDMVQKLKQTVGSGFTIEPSILIGRILMPNRNNPQDGVKGVIAYNTKKLQSTFVPV